jgi:GNAT superfamily N-acetyltransferase
MAAIHRLNYRTFVEEIPQHPKNPSGILIDRFHNENTYCIGMQGDALVAMVAMRSNRPFSLDAKLENLDQYLPTHQRVCELRLLAVEPHARHTRTTLRLFQFLATRALAQGIDLGIMSGTTRQLKLYQRVGFVPFGPIVGSGEARYQPMTLLLDTFLHQTLPLLKMSAD